MANQGLKPLAGFLLLLNFCMYAIVACIAGWALNYALDHTFVIGTGLALPDEFSPIPFPIGNAATGFFVIFSLVASVIGVASAIAGLDHIRTWNRDSLRSAASSAAMAWTLTLLDLGLACKEISLGGRNAPLRTIEAFTVILSATQFVYFVVIHAAARSRI